MNLASFKCKLLKPCKKILHLFKFRLHRKLSIKALRFRHHRRPKLNNTTAHEGRLPKIRSIFHSLRKTREMDRVSELKSFSDAGYQKAPYSSPITPAYVRLSAVNRKEVPGQDDVDDACRSFENYLIEMIVEEGKVSDLVDVEELLYCWNNLRCPVFTDLVCRFYVELCKDLFSDSRENEMKHPRLF